MPIIAGMSMVIVKNGNGGGDLAADIKQGNSEGHFAGWEVQFEDSQDGAGQAWERFKNFCDYGWYNWRAADVLIEEFNAGNPFSSKINSEEIFKRNIIAYGLEGEQVYYRELEGWFFKSVPFYGPENIACALKACLTDYFKRLNTWHENLIGGQLWRRICQIDVLRLSQLAECYFYGIGTEVSIEKTAEVLGYLSQEFYSKEEYADTCTQVAEELKELLDAFWDKRADEAKDELDKDFFNNLKGVSAFAVLKEFYHLKNGLKIADSKRLDYLGQLRSVAEDTVNNAIHKLANEAESKFHKDYFYSLKRLPLKDIINFFNALAEINLKTAADLFSQNQEAYRNLPIILQVVFALENKNLKPWLITMDGNQRAFFEHWLAFERNSEDKSSIENIEKVLDGLKPTWAIIDEKFEATAAVLRMPIVGLWRLMHRPEFCEQEDLNACKGLLEYDDYVRLLKRDQNKNQLIQNELYVVYSEEIDRLLENGWYSNYEDIADIMLKLPYESWKKVWYESTAMDYVLEKRRIQDFEPEILKAMLKARVEKNPESGIAWFYLAQLDKENELEHFQRAADAGYKEAMRSLRDHKDVTPEVKREMALSLARLKDRTLEDQLYLLRYHAGKHGDFKEALEKFFKAGHRINSSDGQNAIVKLYEHIVEHVLDVDINNEDASRWIVQRMNGITNKTSYYGGINIERSELMESEYFKLRYLQLKAKGTPRDMSQEELQWLIENDESREHRVGYLEIEMSYQSPFYKNIKDINFARQMRDADWVPLEIRQEIAKRILGDLNSQDPADFAKAEIAITHEKIKEAVGLMAQCEEMTQEQRGHAVNFMMALLEENPVDINTKHAKDFIYELEKTQMLSGDNPGEFMQLLISKYSVWKGIFGEGKELPKYLKIGREAVPVIKLPDSIFKEL